MPCCPGHAGERAADEVGRRRSRSARSAPGPSVRGSRVRSARSVRGVVAGVVVGGDVPAAVVGDDAPRGELAGRSSRPVSRCSGRSACGARRAASASVEQRLAVGRRGVDPAGEAERLLERLDAAAAARSGSTRRTLASALVGLDAEALGGHQPERDRGRLAGW